MHCISITHKTTPLAIREQFAFSKEQKTEFEKRILADGTISGCVVVSTCNRSEIYFSGNKSGIVCVENQLAEYKNMDAGEMRRDIYAYSNEGAIRHLFRVSCGLDSMVLGEDEILRQVKTAYQTSLDCGHTDHKLNIAFQGALGSAKAVRTDTGVSTTPVSIGTLAANCAGRFLEENGGTTVLVVGISGRMGSIVAKNLCGKRNVRVIGTSRSHNLDAESFSYGAGVRLVDYRDRYCYLKEADVIISATTSPHYTFTYPEVVKELKGTAGEKLFVDLAVPCDIDKEIAEEEGMELIDIDYFEHASKENTRKKRREMDKAELIMDACLDDTLKDIYFQEFYGMLDGLVKKIDEKGFRHFLYRMKKSLGSSQLKSILDSLQEMEGKEE